MSILLKYVHTASTPAYQPYDHKALLGQSKGSCDNCVTSDYMYYDFVDSNTNV